jgi:hypothetical protein
MKMAQAEVERLHRLLGTAVVTAEPVLGRGYAPNRRWIVQLANDRSVFLKQASDENTAAWLRSEYAIYQSLRGNFLPELLGWDDQGEWPMLVLEDLSQAAWPPPWTPGSVEAVLRTLDDLHRHPLVPWLDRISTTQYVQDGWLEIARRPEPFLSLGLCSAAWLDRALPVLLHVASNDDLYGDAVLHLDVRSDNLCLRGNRAILFDWNHSATGNPELDIAFWLPSLCAEGGPEPEFVTKLSPGMVSLVSGFFASRAGLPIIPTAPGVRAIQRVQLETALPWAARVLDLPNPDGRLEDR